MLSGEGTGFRVAYAEVFGSEFVSRARRPKFGDEKKREKFLI